MIKTIKKRNGTYEVFDAAKVNGWGEWAAQSLGGIVDWSSVVMNAVAKLPEVCDSKLLQSTLIQECIDQHGWAYSRMAGRLYIASMRKEIYSGKHPTVKDLHVKLTEKGYLEFIKGYSDEEYRQIERMINHDRDLKYA
jgi:ribonucleoside-diphosphate reductase alpha chain